MYAHITRHTYVRHVYMHMGQESHVHDSWAPSTDFSAMRTYWANESWEICRPCIFYQYICLGRQPTTRATRDFQKENIFFY